MIVTKLRAAATALLLGMAVVTAGGVLSATPAEAAVRSSVGKPLQAALQSAAAGNYSAAMAQVRQAEGVGGLTAEEQKVIGQTRKYIEVKSGGSVAVTTPEGAQAKFDSDYRANRFRDAIADEDQLRRFGALNGTNMVVIAQAYYRSGDNRGCVRYANSHSGAGTAMLDLALRCAYETHDQALMRDAAESLVASSGTPKNWDQLLRLAESTKQLSDPQTLDIYRIRALSGAMTKADEYMTLAQLLIAARLPSEARAIVEKGMAAKIMVDARAQRLYELTKQNQAQDFAGLGRAAAAAQKAPKGDDLVKLGEDYTGMGKFPEAIQAIQASIAKGVSDPDNSQVRLAVAYFGAKQKPQALAALAKANKTPNGEMVARLWSLYIRQH